MKIYWEKNALEDFYWWDKNNKFITKKIKKLIISIKESPFKGLGKPEPLKHQLKKYWSRRINSEHRLIYKITKNKIIVVQCRYHY